MLKDSLNHQPFSLYKLPLVGCLTVVVIFVLFQAIIMIADYSSDVFFHYMYWLDYLVMILSLALSFSVSLGFLMAVFYHFKINCFTKKNIQFTIILMCIAVFILLLFSFLSIELVDHFATEIMALVILAVAMIVPFIYAVLIFFAVKIFKSRLDGYKGTIPSGFSYYYWRLANALAVLTFYVLSTYLLNIIILILADLFFFQISWLLNVSTTLLTISFPVMIYLLIFVFLKRGQLDNLYIKESFVTALYITFVLSVLTIIFGFFADELIYYLAFSGFSLLEFLFYSLVILVIGFFIVLGVVNFGLRDVLRKN